jgi:hypothetical protein
VVHAADETTHDSGGTTDIVSSRPACDMVAATGESVVSMLDSSLFVHILLHGFTMPDILPHLPLHGKNKLAWRRL